MRLGRLAVAGLTAGVVAGFVVALLLPRRRRTVLDLTAAEAAAEAAAGAEAAAVPGGPDMVNHVKQDPRTVAESQ